MMELRGLPAEDRSARRATIASHPSRLSQTSLGSRIDQQEAAMLGARLTRYRVIFVVTTTVLASVCQKSLPTGPSDLAEGLIVYEDDQFRGKTAHITSDIPDLEVFDGPCVKQEIITLPGGGTTQSRRFNWDNCISSVRVAPGWRAILYADDDYRGDRVEVNADLSDLKSVAGSCEQGLNDCISSIRVFRP
jgi:hypothetical protein